MHRAKEDLHPEEQRHQRQPGDLLLMLTDVEAVFRNLAAPDQTAIDRITPDALVAMNFAAGPLGPTMTAASDFVRAGGQMAGIGRVQDARAIVEGRAGTQVRAGILSEKQASLAK